MPLSLINNTASLNAQAALSKTNTGLATTMSRLSSGLRIPNQQDALAQALAARSATRSTNEPDAIAFAQTLDGSLSETTNILHRMRDLASQSLNDTLTASDRETLGNEFSKLKSAALNIAGGTTFNNEDWLTVYSGGATSVAVGDAQLDQRQVALVSKGDAADGILTRSHGGISFSSEGFNISGSSTAEQRQNVLKALDQVISDTGTARYALGS
ncbi:flagellin, partial [Rhizobium sp. LjRoot30]|uniref:flagellin n=1 Tax=Rhizobium sp. LjRoot30 TaxID=3342320 RepID=UPI003F5078EE